MGQLVTSLLQTLGGLPAPIIYLFVALWVGVESAGIGVPIEPVMLFVGSLAAEANHPVLAIFAIPAIVAGCLVFAVIAYEIGRHAGTKSIVALGHFIGLTEMRVEHIEFWLRRRGFAGIIIARLTPVVRTFGSYVMGAAKVPLPQVVVGTVIGSTIYCGFWVILGSALGEGYLQALAVFGRYQNYFFIVAAVALIAYILFHHFWGQHAMHRMAATFERQMSSATGRMVAAGKAAGRLPGKVISRPRRTTESVPLTDDTATGDDVTE